MKMYSMRPWIVASALAALLGFIVPVLWSNPVAGAAPAPFTGFKSVVSANYTFCGLLTSGSVDCWGYGVDGELGDGSTSNSATPVPVEGLGGTGTLSDVASLSAGNLSFCALLTSGEVDCWGYGGSGDLGDGNSSNRNTTTPVQVVGVGDTGTLSGVASLNASGVASVTTYCAVLHSGGVDCWGAGGNGQLGDGNSGGSATPVEVDGVGQSTLSGVTSLSIGGDTCALLTSSGVDCWGNGTDTPQQVVGVSGSGTLSGVTSLSAGSDSECALLSSSGVDCWSNVNGPSLQVVGVGGSGTLSGVTSLSADATGFCAVLTSGDVDCWGYSYYGGLGDDQYTGGATPVQVVGVGDSGILSGVASVSADQYYSFCAILIAGGVDCWGYGNYGELGNGTFYSSGNMGSATPVQVEDVAAEGSPLSGVASLGNGGDDRDFCAVLTSGGVDCWGDSSYGQLGNGSYSKSATPVQVVSYGTQIVLPSNDTAISGNRYLDATVSPGVTELQYEISGTGLNDYVVATAVLTEYGWLADWNSTDVPNGFYTLQSVASSAGLAAASPGIAIAVDNAIPTTSVLIPSMGAALTGTTYLDASASNATSVEFLLFGGPYGYSAPVICTATPTIYGWLCSWNTETVPDDPYVLVSEAFNSTGSAFSSGVSVTVKN